MEEEAGVMAEVWMKSRRKRGKGEGGSAAGEERKSEGGSAREPKEAAREKTGIKRGRREGGGR